MVGVIEPQVLTSIDGVEGAPVEFETRVPPGGEVTVLSGRQRVSLQQAMAGRTVTVWADLRSVHLTQDGHLVRTVASRLRPEDLRHLTMRGARPGGPSPAKPALRRLNGTPVLPDGGTVEIDRVVTRDGKVTIAGHHHLIGFAWAGRAITLRLDGHLMHAIADNALIGSWPCPFNTNQLTNIRGARIPSTPLPPPPLPAGSLRAQRRVHASGRILVAGQRIKLGPRHRGKLVTVVVEDTYLRVLHGEEEIAVHPRRNLTPSPASTSPAPESNHNPLKNVAMISQAGPEPIHCEERRRRSVAIC
jgi:hypothetical protein